MSANPENDYEAQAWAFLAKFSIGFKATWKDSHCPPWEGENGDHIHGDRYRINLKAAGRLISFDFWNSKRDSDLGISPTAYDVLACISGDVYCPEEFSEFCSEYGYDEDSRKAFSTFKRADRFGRRLRAFFTEAEIEGLEAIR